MITDKEYLNKELQICKKTIDEAKLPTWDELPKLELYMDQVVSVLEESLEIFSRNEKLITPSMINNYVKQKIVKPPIKKKYDRVHLAYLYVVCILKRIMPISQICDGMAFAMKKYPIPEAYNRFCDELEGAIGKAFGIEGPVISASRMAVENPRLFIDTAKSDVISDLPTPPLPLTTA